ncbi:major capsid protein [Jeotgalibacillus terrae]|uniref:Major capsid protein n=1 Tax=Jeotgalibacillus terrae TaxID=587735 RepID=A0ABW5ZH58_9BACL|nr:major capsid protein [Jeotgalibacillus terrae]MBM7580015.1 hypothetical protein [Jeotgalibacillus terrae]
MAINVHSTRFMLEAVSNLKPAHTFLRDMFFGTPKTFVTEHVDVEYRKGRRKMAPFVSPLIAGKVMERSGTTMKTFTPATIKPMRPITAHDINKRAFGEGVYSTRTPEARALEMLAEDLIFLDEAITRREEWMAAQVIFTGKVEIIGEGVDAVMDYGFTNKETLSGTDLWSDGTNSDPYGDLERYRLAVIKNSGVTADRVIMSSDVGAAFVSHPKVQKMLENRRITMGNIEPQKLANGVTYIGTIAALGLELYTYDEWYFDEETEEEKPMIPEGTLAVLSSRTKSQMLYGAVTLADHSTENFTTYEGERVPDSWIQKDPAARFLQMHSKPLPVPTEVDAWYVAKVL